MILHVKNKSCFVIAILKVEKLKEAFSHFQMDSIVNISREKSENKLARKIFQSKMKLPPPNSADKSNSIENHISKVGAEEILQKKSFYWVSVRGGALYRIIGIFQWLISTAGPVLRFLTLSARKSFEGSPNQNAVVKKGNQNPQPYFGVDLLQKHFFLGKLLWLHLFF